MSDTASQTALRLLATLGTAVYLVFGTVLLAVPAFLLSWLPPPGKVVLFWCRVWAHGVLAVAGVRVTVSFDPAFDPGRGYVFLVNHLSYFDVPVLLVALPGEVRFAARSNLFSIPVFGWALSAGGFIAVDREDRRQALEVYGAAAARLRAGDSVLFFPEGTRSPDRRLHRFHRGGFLVAQKCEAAIVPVGVRGTWEVMARHRRSILPGRARVRVGAPIETADYPFSRKRELMERVRAEIATLAGLAGPESVD